MYRVLWRKGMRCGRMTVERFNVIAKGELDHGKD